jgi:hypothetical protein
MNETKEKTCADRIAENLAGEEANLKEIYDRLDGKVQDEEESETQTIDSAYEDFMTTH